MLPHRSSQSPTIVLVLREHDSIWTPEARAATLSDVAALHAALTLAGYRVIPVQLMSPADLPKSLSSFNPKDCVVLNWYEGFASDARDGVEVVERLEAMGFTYTGSHDLAWQTTQNKIRAKRLMHAHAIPTPRWQALHEENLDEWNIYPAIVKVANDHGSEYLTFDSVVHDARELCKHFGELQALDVRQLMVAEYIEGEEFTVALWGNGTLQTLPLVQVDFSALPPGVPHIRTYDAKWDPTADAYHAIKLSAAPHLAPEVECRIARVAQSAYRAFGLRDYGRVDIRLRNGTPFVIDVNANPDITIEGSFFAAARFGGYDYSAMLDYLVRLASERAASHSAK